MFEMQLSDISDNLNKKILAGFLIGLAVGVSLFYGYSSYGEESGQDVAENLASVLEQDAGEPLEVINYEERNGVYEINLRNTENNVFTYHATKDGQLFSAQMMDINEVEAFIQAERELEECMRESGTIMYGNQTEEETVAQIQVIGERVVGSIYRDVNNEQVLEEAVSQGIESLPAFYRDGSTLEGVHSVEDVAEFSGCSQVLLDQ